MGSYTAQILIGHEHQHHGGLLLGSIQQMFLSENSRPAWQLFGPRPLTDKPIASWIPQGPETILEDGVLMAVYFVAKDEAIASAFRRKGLDPVINPFELGELPQEFLLEIRSIARKSRIEGDLKLIVAAFEGSSVISQVGMLANYALRSEVLLPKPCRT
jgi:hypothetical protein